MKFRRINDTTIRCIVSKEDMQAYGLALEDFFKNKSKVHEFLHEVVEKAEEEVGYEPREGMLSMQIIPISPNSIAITFSESEDDNSDMLMQNIKDTIRGLLTEEAQQEMEESDSYEELEDAFDLYDDVYLDEDESEAEEYREDSRERDFPEKTFPICQTMMISMNSLEELAAYCKAAAVDKTVKSDLYYLVNRDAYCMIIEKGRLSTALFRHLVMLAVEFDSRITNNEYMISHVREHGELMLEKKAYRILRKNY